MRDSCESQWQHSTQANFLKLITCCPYTQSARDDIECSCLQEMDPEPVADGEGAFNLQEAEQADLQQALRDQVVAPRVAACVCLHRLSCIASGHDATLGADDQQAAGKGFMSRRKPSQSWTVK